MPGKEMSAPGADGSKIQARKFCALGAFALYTR